jgi:hypothetical protein
MHRHSATIVGGALTLADLIMSGKVLNGLYSLAKYCAVIAISLYIQKPLARPG